MENKQIQEMSDNEIEEEIKNLKSYVSRYFALQREKEERENN